ncbi:MAG TPA: SDR family oxidoreductase [Streptosporangiaceae bacterium]|nr:SDR family oxidoreductase [Streptosporangiaceae bacterium]
MGDESGQSFLVTGGNTGIGLATATELARRGGRVYVACRSEAKGSHAVASIVAATGNPHVSYLPLDLADLSSVRACAKEFLATGQPLHALINNAGVAGRHELTADGFELAFGVNHLGHFVLTRALLGRLAECAPARVVTVSSDAHYKAKGIDFTALRRPDRSITAMRSYAVSKLCNLLFSQELARRLDGRGVTTYALHPGMVGSDMWRRVPAPFRSLITARMLTPEQGAQTSLYCATSAELAGQTGLFYDKCAERKPSAVATADLGRILWERSEAWAGS